MFCSRAAEMLRRGLRSMDELDAVEARERDSIPAPSTEPNSAPGSSPDDSPLDPVMAEAITEFDPLAPFWANYDLGFRTSSS
jgi:hypothetical protein